MKILTPDEARQIWPVLEPAITRALSRQGPPQPIFQTEVFQAIWNGQAHVLLNDGVGVVFVDGDVCHLVAYTGTIREIKLLTAQAKALAKAAGCSKIRWTGDQAWLRVVPGARVRAVVMELDI